MRLIQCSNCGYLIELEGAFPPDLLCPRCKKRITRAAEVDSITRTAQPPRERSAGEQIFGNYEILEEVSRGAMGIVYKARQMNLNRLVALKVLIAGERASEEQIERFYRETQAVARLRHPNIIPIYDMGTEKGRYYFSMEFVEGESLEKKIERGKIGLNSALEIIGQVASAIAHAHERGIIHRDIKPANILIDSTGRVQVTDFGLAKETGKSATRTGITVGTPHYMSVEQARGESCEVDERSDIYSLGAVLYEMLTGRPPFDGPNAVDIILKVLYEEPIPPRKLNRRIPRDLEVICTKALQKEKSRRYQSAAEFLTDIRRFRASEPITTRPINILQRTYRSIKKHKQLASAVLVGFAALAAVYFISDWRAKKAFQREKESAQREKETAGREKKLQETLQSQQKLQEKWRTLFASAFTEESLEKWLAERGNWKAVDGALYCASETEAAITFSEPIPGNIRVSFDFILDAPLSGYFGLSLCSAGKEPCSGYRFLFFANRTALQKDDTTKKIISSPLEANTSYRIVAVRENDVISLRVDDKELLSYQDLIPLTGEAASFFRFILSGAEVRVANLVIEKESIPLQTSPLFVADKLFNDGLYTHAAEGYRTVAESPPDAKTAAEALYKVGLSFVKLDSRSEALSYFKQLIARFPESKYAQAAKLQVGLCYLNLKEYDNFRKAVKEYNLDLSLQDILREAPLSVVENYLADVERPRNAQTPEERIPKLKEFILVQTSLPEERRDHEKLSKAYLSLAAILTSGNQHQEAAKTYRELLERYPASVRYAFEAQFQLAKTYCSLNDLASAAVVLQELIVKYPPEVVADALLGKKVKGLEDVPPSSADAKTYQLVISFAQERNIAQQTLTYIFLELDRADEALSLLASIEKEHSARANPAAQAEKANAQLSQELAPYSAIQTAWARFWLGNVYIILGNTRKALDTLYSAELSSEKTSQMPPAALSPPLKESPGTTDQSGLFAAASMSLHNANVELALFVCCTKLGKKNEAKQHLKTALSISPGFFGSATQTVSNVLATDPLPEELPESAEANSSAYYYLTAVTLLAEKENEKAEFFLRRATASGKIPWPYYPANAELTALKRPAPGF
jgi:serine/threonine protein kinase/outer membrane protein assembly factor BamD (BamD/ComL family)